MNSDHHCTLTPRATCSAIMLLPRCDCSAWRIIREKGSAVRSVTRYTHPRMTGARFTSLMPWVRASVLFISDEEGPGEHLVLEPHHPDGRPLGRRACGLGLGREAVVGEVRVEEQDLLGIDLGRHRPARVLDRHAVPAAAAVPCKPALLAVGERHEDGDRE